MKKWVLPPDGRKYGFPKVWDCVNDIDAYDWIVEQGYPAEKVDGSPYFYLKIWDYTDTPKRTKPV